MAGRLAGEEGRQTGVAGRLAGEERRQTEVVGRLAGEERRQMGGEEGGSGGLFFLGQVFFDESDEFYQSLDGFYDFWKGKEKRKYAFSHKRGF